MWEHNNHAISEFRANHGKVSGCFENVDIALFTIIGAKTGIPRTVPVTYFLDSEQMFVIASAAGAHKHPNWYHNLIANPDLTVEVGSEAYQATAALSRTKRNATASSTSPSHASRRSRTALDTVRAAWHAAAKIPDDQHGSRNLCPINDE
jgi:deazaflavin-dependent oxidoreductase (nitroreductase family)